MSEKKQPRAIFYKVSIDDSNPKALMGAEEETQGFNHFRFHNGEWINDWPEGITFSYTMGEVAEDYLADVAYWDLVSERVRQVFVQHNIKGAQFLPIKAIHKQTGKEVGKYWALNVIEAVEALDWTHTIWSTSAPESEEWPQLCIFREALLYERLRGIDIFTLRIKGKRHFGIFISARLKQWLEEAGATSGFAFFPIPAY